LAKTDLDERGNIRALVLGCGTGPLACALKQRGYQVSGFDVSPTAIEMARKQAQKRGLDIDYWVADLCRDRLPTARYDLIVDSHCLHCIVPDEDRKKAFQEILQGLDKEGVFILETMMGKMNSNGVSSDENGIVWTSYGTEKPDFEPAVQQEGLWYVPQRLLRPSKESLDAELKAYGFHILWSHEESTDAGGELSDYQAICMAAHPK